MRKYKEITEKNKVQVLDKCLCDTCKKELDVSGACGFGANFTLRDAWCTECGGKSWDFCSLKCLKEFVNKNKLEEPKQQ